MKKPKPKLPRGIHVRQDPELLERFKLAIAVAFQDALGFDPPVALVVRALEQLFIEHAETIRKAVPVARGPRTGRPAAADHATWDELEHEVLETIRRALRPGKRLESIL